MTVTEIDNQHVDDRLVSVDDFATGGLYYARSGGPGADIIIERARQFALVHRRSLYFPQGHYRITQPIDLSLNGSQDTVQMSLIGDNATDDLYHGSESLIEWNSSVKDNMILAHGRGLRVAGLTLRAAPGKAVDACIDIDKGALSIGTRIVVENCLMYGDAGGGYGSIDYGIAGARGTPAQGNVESIAIRSCSILAATEAGIYNGSTSGQAKWWHVWNCTIAGVTGATISKHCCLSESSSFVIDGASNFGYTSQAAVQFNASPYDTVSIQDLNTEGLFQLLSLAVTSAACPVLISNCRFAITTSVNGAGRYINWQGAGPIHIENTIWSAGAGVDPAILHLFAATVVPMRCVSECNVYTNATPFHSDNTGGNMGLDVDSLGDGWLVSPNYTALPSTLNVHI